MEKPKIDRVHFVMSDDVLFREYVFSTYRDVRTFAAANRDRIDAKLAAAQPRPEA